MWDAKNKSEIEINASKSQLIQLQIFVICISKTSTSYANPMYKARSVLEHIQNLHIQSKNFSHQSFGLIRGMTYTPVTPEIYNSCPVQSNELQIYGQSVHTFMPQPESCMIWED
jgi:hypothetical protein